MISYVKNTASIVYCYKPNDRMSCIHPFPLSIASLGPEDLTHEMLEDWRICLRQVLSLHNLCPPTCDLRFPQAFCDVGREQNGADWVCVVDLRDRQ